MWQYKIDLLFLSSRIILQTRHVLLAFWKIVNPIRHVCFYLLSCLFEQHNASLDIITIKVYVYVLCTSSRCHEMPTTFLYQTVCNRPFYVTCSHLCPISSFCHLFSPFFWQWTNTTAAHHDWIMRILELIVIDVSLSTHLSIDKSEKCATLEICT